MGWKRQDGEKKGEMIFLYISIRAIGIYRSLYTECLTKDSPEFLFNLPEIQIPGIFLRYNDDIVSLGEMCFVESEGFSYKPLNPISFNRISSLFTNSDPQSCDALPVPLCNQGKVFCIKALTRAI